MKTIQRKTNFYWYFLGIILVIVLFVVIFYKKNPNISSTINNDSFLSQKEQKQVEEQYLDRYLQAMEKQIQEEKDKRAQEQKTINEQTKVIQDKLKEINKEIQTFNEQINTLEEEIKDSNLNDTTKKDKEAQLAALQKPKEDKIKEGQDWKAKIPELYSQKENNAKQLEWLTYQHNYHNNFQKQGYLEQKSKTLEEVIVYNQANKARIKFLLSQNRNNKDTFDQLKDYYLFLDSQLIIFSHKLEEIRKEFENNRLDQPWLNHKKKITLEDVYGMEQEKEELADLIAYLKVDQPSLVNFEQIKPRGYLLYGPPGTGKSFLMKALCEETEAYYLEVDPSRFDKTFIGEGNEELERIWEEAEKHNKCIIFIDEISGLANRENISHYGGEHSKIAFNILNNLLLKLDGFKSSDNKKIILMGATNHLSQIDPALRSRFSKIIKINLIQDAEIEGFLKHQLRNYQISYHTFNHLKEIANRCQGKGYSNRDLTKFLDNAYQKTFKYQQQNPLHSIMLPSDLDEVLDFQQGIKKTLSQIKEHRLACEKEYQDWLKEIESYLPKKKDLTEVSKKYSFNTLTWPDPDEEPSDILSFVKQPFQKWFTDANQYAFNNATLMLTHETTMLSKYITFMKCEEAPGYFWFVYEGPQYLLDEDKDYYIGDAELPYDPNNQVGIDSTKKYYLHFNPCKNQIMVYDKKFNTE
ncbi:AAA family ATPase [Candidatus Phytoplasma sacchari]|uniref:AAA family ATPase n=1 Tax=Candidatus Phytoplasma sacchari TaxID=2609813 RepID=A0ABY7M1N0_9MOLU|nr:AAA family ATPase [Candidatus Phytoplasma sacchari]